MPREFQPFNFESLGAMSEQVLARREQKAANRSLLAAIASTAFVFALLFAVVLL